MGNSKTRRRLPTRFALGLFLVAAASFAVERRLDLDPGASRVTFTLPATGHDVEGAFRLTHGALRFDSATGSASGEIVVDATAGATGNKSRDKTMQQEVLEVAAFPEIRLRIESVAGDVPETGHAEFELRGKLTLHGAEHAVVLPVSAEIGGGRAVAETRFPVPFLDWGLHDPSILFLRVEPVVTVSVHAEGALAAVPAAGGGR